MKRSKLYVLSLALLAGIFLSLAGCKKCTDTGTVTISPDNQYFTVKYVEPDGTPYIDSIFNLANVSILWADYSPFQTNPQFAPVPYTEDWSDGLMGPIPYTSFPTTAQLGVYHHFKFVIKADTFGWDTIDLEYLPTADQCKEYWAEISYFLNGVQQTGNQDQEIANITITR